MSARTTAHRTGRRVFSACVALAVLSRFDCSTVFAAPCWQPPVTAAVVDPFRLPSCPWCPGNRGIEYATQAGDDITSVAAGTVTFAGSIAGVGYVVVEVTNRWRITYGNLSDIHLRAGDTVVAGLLIGQAAGAFHFGLREGDDYLDPAPYLGEWQFAVRLVPTDGAPAAAGRPPALRCSNGGASSVLNDAPGRKTSLRR